MTLLLLFVSGLFFAAWPHAMRESGLSGAPSLLMYGGAAFVGGVVWVAASRSGSELHGMPCPPHSNRARRLEISDRAEQKK